MAAELFRTLKDATGAGIAPHRRVEGNAVAGTDESPVLGGKDLAGNFQHTPIRTEGDATATALNVPVLAVKDSSGNLRYIPLTAAGAIPVDSNPGTPVDKFDEEPSVLTTEVLVATLTLVAGDIYSDIQAKVSSAGSIEWRVEQVDDATITTITKQFSGPGEFAIDLLPKNIQRTAGATGTQEINVYGTMTHGAPTTLFAHISASQNTP